MNRYRWAVDNSESIDAEVVEILPDGRGFRAIRGVTTLAGLCRGAVGSTIAEFGADAAWRVNGNVQELVAIWPTTARLSPRRPPRRRRRLRRRPQRPDA